MDIAKEKNFNVKKKQITLGKKGSFWKKCKKTDFH